MKKRKVVKKPAKQKQKSHFLLFLLAFLLVIVGGGGIGTAYIFDQSKNAFNSSTNVKICDFSGTDWTGYIAGVVELKILTEPSGGKAGTTTLVGNTNYEAKNLVIPDFVRDDRGRLYSIVEIGSEAFIDNNGLVGDLTISANVHTISEAAFKNCAYLNGQLIIKDGVKIIEKAAFFFTGFSGLLTIPSSITKIGKTAFAGEFFNITKIQFMAGCSNIFGLFDTDFNYLDTLIFNGYNSIPNWGDQKTDVFVNLLPRIGTVKSINGKLTSLEALAFCRANGLTDWIVAS